jgi:hypothetical protein
MGTGVEIKKWLPYLLRPLLTPLRGLFFFFAAPCLLFIFITFNAFESTAITQSHWSLSHADLQRVKKILSTTASKSPTEINLNEKDLNIALSYLLNYYIDNSSQIVVRNKRLHFQISLFLTNDYFGNYLNFSFNLTKKQGYPVINSLKIGKIRIADEFAGLILESIVKYTSLKQYYILAADHIHDIQISNKRLTINYVPSTDINFINKLKLNNKHYQAIVFYQWHITRIIAQHDPKWRLSLAELLQPLFKLAYQRSTTANAIAENRAVLLAISTYVNKAEIQTYIPFDISPTASRQYPVSLYRRNDTAQHFMISAALAASGAETLAYILGQEKEINDAKQGNGFSFIDLACDRAGLKFGKTAVSSPGQARELQYKMANIKDYTAFMPDVRDLPENMNEEKFKQQFESVYSTTYQNMLKKIDLRVSKLTIYDQHQEQEADQEH